MEKIRIVKGFKDNTQLRKSFNNLASSTFGIDFEEWYKKGYWTDKYEPHSIVIDDKVISNVSVNQIDLYINGDKKQGLQIGTVMTHPDYRGRGLSKKLMDYILKQYEGKYDVMYLFANQTVLDFYPKFGFKRMEEYQYYLTYKPVGTLAASIQHLNGKNEKDSHFIYEFCKERAPVSKQFGSVNTQELFMFYCIYIFSEDIYYLDDLDVLLIFKHEGEVLHLFDIVSNKEVNIIEVIARVALQNTNTVKFHYNPDYKNIKTESSLVDGGDVLFVKANDDVVFPKRFKHPITTQA